MLPRILLSTAACATLTGVVAAQGSFQVISPPGTFDQAIGISPSGEYVVGGGGTNGFLWSQAGGLVTGFGAPMDVWGVTDDGGTLVGTALNGSSQGEAARWTTGGGLDFLGNAGGAAGCGSDLSDLNSVSADGTTAVGMSWQGCRTSPLRWTQGVGLTLLSKQDANSSARCYAVSDDGVVAVGWDSGLPSGSGTSRRACIWFNDTTQYFPCTTGANPNGLGEVVDVNSDGTIVCGVTQQNAFVWRAGQGLQILPKVPGQNGNHTANAGSEDGSVVVGVYFLPGIPPTFRAFIWTQATGTMDLADYMTAQGLSGFPVADIDNATGISADGTTICGWGGTDAWVVRFGEDTWVDLGQALAGVAGEPALVGSGDLTANSPVALDLTGAAPSAGTYLVAGLTDLSAPFKGGVLVPFPDLVFTLATDGAGELHLASTWPAGVPPAVTVWWQCWIQDAAGPVGFAASNALSSTTP